MLEAEQAARKQELETEEQLRRAKLEEAYALKFTVCIGRIRWGVRERECVCVWCRVCVCVRESVADVCVQEMERSMLKKGEEAAEAARKDERLKVLGWGAGIQ